MARCLHRPLYRSTLPARYRLKESNPTIGKTKPEVTMKPKRTYAISLRNGGARPAELKRIKAPKPKTHLKAKLIKANGKENPIRRRFLESKIVRTYKKDNSIAPPVEKPTHTVNRKETEETVEKWIENFRVPVERPWSNIDRINGRKLAHAIATAQEGSDLY